MRQRPRQPLRTAYALLHASATATIVTGVIYGVMRYICESADPFSVVNHPLEPLFHTLHVIVAPGLTLMLGVFWVSHAWPYFRSGQRNGRRSGLWLWGMTLPMIVSAYLLQTATLWRLFWVWAHVVTSLIWMAALALHIAAHIRRRNA